MKSRLIPALLLACAPSAPAQTLQPQFYLWANASEAPPGWSEHQVLPMTIVGSAPNWYTDPVDCAIEAAQKIQEYADAGFPLDRICILIQNFGHGVDEPFSFIDRRDVITPEPAFLPGTVGPNDPIRFATPWMNHGIPKVKAWMEDFLAAYSAQQFFNPSTEEWENLPRPARFHFDTELYPGNCCEVNYVRILAALPVEGDAIDNRWYTLPVPGFGTRTMATLYADAKTRYGWPNVTLPMALNLAENAEHDVNRPYFLWFLRICQRARDAAMKEAAYDVIRDHWPNDPPLVSNYGDAYTDGRPGQYGWYPRPDHAQSPSVPIPDRASIHAQISEFVSGSRYFIGDLEDPTEDYVSVWYALPAVASGDFSAPYLYTYHNSHCGPNYYLPNWPTESIWDASLRNHRHWLESILGSGVDPSEIAVWVPLIGTSTHKETGYFISAEDARRQFAMLRAKNIGEVMVWWDRNAPALATWAEYHKAIRQVYSPVLDSYLVLEGTCAQVPVSALHYTLVDPGNDVLNVVSSTAGAAAIIAHFEGLWPNAAEPKLGDRLRINRELSVGGQDVHGDDLRARAYIWKPSILDWVEVPCPDTSTNEILFAAPPNPADGWYDMRRTLTIDHCAVEGDTLNVKVVVYSLLDPAPTFTVSYDLVQVYWAEEGPVYCSGPDDTQGADMTYDGTVSIHDFNKFSADYIAGRPSADYNNDRSVTADDLAAFLAAYQP